MGSRATGLAALLVATGLMIACGSDSQEATASKSVEGGSSSPAETTSPESTLSDPTPLTASQQALAARGRSVYMANCIACHAPDPSQEGGLGPAVVGSSRELLETRVLRAEYPPGYTPKKTTQMMIPLLHLENEIEALFAFLN
jgi:mono/diheme cytochrome c family protein